MPIDLVFYISDSTAKKAQYTGKNMLHVKYGLIKHIDSKSLKKGTCKREQMFKRGTYVFRRI